MAKSHPSSSFLRPLKLGLLNLMPNKDETEAQFITWLNEAGQPATVQLLRLDTYQPKHAPADYDQRYARISEVSSEHFDRLIITGAPIGRRELVQGGPNGVAYLNELYRIFDWSKTHATETLNVCWAAAAALNHFHGVTRQVSPVKLFGVSQQHVVNVADPLTSALGRVYDAPVSRTVLVQPEQIRHIRGFEVLSLDPETGIGLARDRVNRQVLCFNHLEYEAERLGHEYKRDVLKGINPGLPSRYDLANPQLSWQSARTSLLRGWLKPPQSAVRPLALPAVRYNAA